MDLKSLNSSKGESKSKSPPKNEHTVYPLTPEEAVESIEALPLSFNAGDLVVVKNGLQVYSKDLKRIAGIDLEVDRCFYRDLGEGVVAEILYLIGDHVENPYLAEHFKRLE